MKSALTTLCYIEKDGCYLMLHRISKRHDINKGKWIGIGGHFERRESPEDCLLREVKEETGLTLTSFKLRGVVTFLSDDDDAEYMFVYSATAFSGETGECREGKLEWVRKGDIKTIEHWEGDLIFLDLIERGAPFFSLKLSYKEGVLTEAVLDGRRLR